MNPESMVGAKFSEDRVYRYQLWRVWDDKKPYLNVIGLNPSTADERKDDPTIRRCISFAKAWGFGGLYMTNLFAYRATKPADMKKYPEPIGQENDRYLRETAINSGLCVAAWGANGGHQGRDAQVEALIPNLYVFRLTEKSGVPEHPLYLPKDLMPILLSDARQRRADGFMQASIDALKSKIEETAASTANPELANELRRLID